jgi:peptide deformylase
MILKIYEVGNPVLRKVARSLSADEIRSKDIQDLIAYMRDTMQDAPGVGLAAPQIGESLQITVIEDKAEYQKALTAGQLSERQASARRFPHHHQSADRSAHTSGCVLL